MVFASYFFIQISKLFLPFCNKIHFFVSVWAEAQKMSTYLLFKIIIHQPNIFKHERTQISKQRQTLSQSACLLYYNIDCDAPYRM